MKLGDFFRESKWSQKEFADKVGCTEAAISQYVNGLRMPSLVVALRIQEATMGLVSCRDLANGSEPPSQDSTGTQRRVRKNQE